MKASRKKTKPVGKRISRKVDALVVLIYGALIAAAAVREVAARRKAK